jgi:hypothetical protein
MSNIPLDEKALKIRDLAIQIFKKKAGVKAFESQSRTHEIKDYDSYCILSISPDHIAVEGNARIEILRKSNLTVETKLDIH